MNNYFKRIRRSFIVAIIVLNFTPALEASDCPEEDDFAHHSIQTFNHEGYRNTSMGEDCRLGEAFDVAECDAFEGCNILDAAAAKAGFASQRYLQASIALERAASVYHNSGHDVAARHFQDAAEVAKSAHLAFQSLSTFDAEGLEKMNLRSYDDLKEVFLHIDPIYLDCCKLCAKAFASSVSTGLFISDVVQASAYHESATAAAFRAYQFFYAGIESNESVRNTQTKDKGSLSSWLWGMIGY